MPTTASSDSASSEFPHNFASTPSSVTAHLMMDTAACRQRIEQSIIVANVHCLPSMASMLFGWLIQAGFRPDRIFVVPKPYSSIPSAIAELRSMGITVVNSSRRARSFDGIMHANIADALDLAGRSYASGSNVVLLDDGGLLTDTWAKWHRSTLQRTISIQQTTSGTNRPLMAGWRIPWIDVARSVAKLRFESPIIARGLVRKLRVTDHFIESSSIGIVGVGALGSHLVSAIREQGKAVFWYDARPVSPIEDTFRCDSLSELFHAVDGILGCTGKNWLSNRPIENLFDRQHWLASCSSRDIEFKKVLDVYGKGRLDLFDDAVVTAIEGGAGQVILNGGFPVNFDRSVEWEKPEEICLTRALLFGAVIQSIGIRGQIGETHRVQLDPELQRRVVQEWLPRVNIDPMAIGVSAKDLGDAAWWARSSRSGGR